MVDTGELEIFRHSLKSIVEEMGVTLQRTAYSTNIKIRRDHTCALFDADLRHIAQHDIAPQHIGSLVSVIPKNVPDWEDDLEPGDGILINDPDKGAVHLPDVMLISPLFHDDEIVGYAANSAHHVDIGGGTPGGIPNDSTELYAEGLIIPGVRAVRDWSYDEQILSLILRNVRRPDMRRGDYQAQLGTNRIGEQRFTALYESYGAEQLTTYLDELLDYTERRVRAAIADLPDGQYTAEDYMDGDGIVDEPVRLRMAITVDGDEITVDFTGTAAENTGPLNCTPAMIFAGTMSVIMAFIGTDLPKNDGFYRPFEVITPEGTMVNPSDNAPVAGGWEIPMRAGDLVTKALADAVPEETIGATKGMVCNVAYGGTDPRNESEYVYYETVAGGYGGRATKDGMDAVQTHFQNTANSPIEELESELPVYVRRYELIPDSAGAGRQRGGLGVRRDLEFSDHSASFSLLTDRTRSAPWGVFGGKSARPSRFRRNPDTDAEVELESKSTTQLDPDDVVSIQTPGGGGYGDPLERDPDAVLEDVRNEKVSPEAAREAYGVELTDETNVDGDATAARRSELRDTAAADGGELE
ncbi:hydantoinase B/oxoprolinase family protein [Natronorubrum texcoconense]|uniref:N-methylhydantoinase B n=1 Tax=Natronorubrum texcoconense TaxID=1095776 RepID=A0A1G9D1E4_9EURY|nr:hydantoinase B/oxoprolinase family protein [Natronorubrum texcoconense]SDK57524.1 N-methylhydantoinase B [Natronorubrum texcoconense]